MVLFMHRPSPQIPKPSSSAAKKCFDSAEFIINISSRQLKSSAIDITWVFLLTIYMAVNTTLWSISYPEVRKEHPKEALEGIINNALDILDQCAERWPGAASASQLYAVFAKACMQSYERKEPPPPPISNGIPFTTSPSLLGSPAMSDTSSMPQSQAPMFSMPQFSYGAFKTEPAPAVGPFGGFGDPFRPAHPQFRSGSIFLSPGSGEQGGRRPSAYAPDVAGQKSPGEITPTAPISPAHPAQQQQHPQPMPHASPPLTDPLPTPPESAGGNMLSPSSTTFAGNSSPTPTLMQTSPMLNQATPVQYVDGPLSQPTPQQTPVMAQQQQQQTGRSPVVIPPLRQGAPQQQRPLPTTVTDWFSPPPPLISPYAAFSAGNGNNSYFPDPSSTFSGLGLGGAMGAGYGGVGYGFPERQGSLSQEQQVELMGMLEADGMSELDGFLNMSGVGGSGLGGQEPLQW
jgi:hypothetical protein